MDSGFLQIPHWLPSGSCLAILLILMVQGEFLRAPLPLSTCSLLPRAMAGLAPASRLACRSHVVRFALTIYPYSLAFNLSAEMTLPRYIPSRDLGRRLPVTTLNFRRLVLWYSKALFTYGNIEMTMEKCYVIKIFL